jgi:hypothetical protein
MVLVIQTVKCAQHCILSTTTELIEIPKYIALYHTNPASWPSNPKQSLAMWQGTGAGAGHLLKMGIAKEIGRVHELGRLCHIRSWF